MHPPSRRALSLIIGLCAAITPLSAYSQSPDGIIEETIEEIVVVAHHLPVAGDQVGSAVSVLDTQDFATRLHFEPASLFRTLPSLNVSQSGPMGGLTEIRMRGSESNHTLVLIDGVEANDIANGSTFNLFTLAGTEIERIEVLRGPQSARYGSETIGGVIAISTRKRPTETSPDHDLVLGLESGNRGFQLGSIRARSQKSLGTDLTWSNRMGITRGVTDGTNASFFGDEDDGFQNTAWHFSSSLDWVQGASITASLRQTTSDADGDPQDFATPATPTQGLVIDGNERNRARQQLAAVTATLHTGAWQHSIVLSQNDNKTRFRVDGDVSSGLEGTQEKADWSMSRVFSHNGLEHGVTFGLQYEERRFGNFSAQTAAANHQAEDRQRSQFAEYLLQGDGRALSLSVRHDNNDGFANLTTWRMTASQNLSEHLRMHGSWGEGSANPTFFELFGFIPESFTGNPNLQPERSRGWDLGVSGAACQGRCQWDMTYFRSRLSDEITTTYPEPLYLAYPVNVTGDSRRRGLELSLSSQLSQTFGIDANFTWLHSEDALGQEEVRRPRRSGSVTGHLSFADERGKASFSVIYNGATQDNEFISATPQTRAPIASTALLNASVSYAVSNRFSLFARGQNLLDKKYQQVFGYRAPGVTASVGIRVQRG